MSKRRGGQKWRQSVIDLYGMVCAADGTPGSECLGSLEAHHLIYRSQGGPDVAQNGLMVCTRHHSQIHARVLLVRPEWLVWEAKLLLAEHGAVAWDRDGRPYGRHWKGFAVVASRDDGNPDLHHGEVGAEARLPGAD